MKAKRTKSLPARKSRKPSADDGEAFDPFSSPISAFEPFEKQYSRAQTQQLRIIEAAVTSYATRGIAGTSYTTLAADCEISRPLIHHYFPTLDSLIAMTAKFIRAKQLQVVAQQLKQTTGGMAQLKAYVNASFSWLEQNPNYARFLLLYFYQCSLGGQIAAEHDNLMKAGENKIDQILQEIENEGHKVPDRQKIAKTIQIIMFGGTIGAVAEKSLTFSRSRELTLRAVDALLNSK